MSKPKIMCFTPFFGMTQLQILGGRLVRRSNVFSILNLLKKKAYFPNYDEFTQFCVN